MHEPEYREVQIVQSLPKHLQQANGPAFDEFIAAQAIQNVINQVGETSKPKYTTIIRQFIIWLHQGNAVRPMTRSTIIDYRSYLSSQYKKQNTLAHKWAVLQRFLREYCHEANLSSDGLLHGISGFKQVESHKHIALTTEQVIQMLAAPDRSTKAGERDYLVLYLVFKAALRREEISNIRLGHFRIDNGYDVLLLVDPKGEQGGEQQVKIREEVKKAVHHYLTRLGWAGKGPAFPLITRIRKNDQVTDRALTGFGVYEIIVKYAASIGVKMTAHSGRATAITLMFEAENADPVRIMETARHKRIETTLKYRKRRDSLKDNAVDYLTAF